MPESFWTSWAHHLPAWNPADAPLFVVAPHPDDETLGAGGLIHAWSERGLPITILCVTDGEAACPEIPDLARIRRHELSCALRELGAVQANMVRLQWADGSVAKYENSLVEAIRHHLRSRTLLVAPFELDGHPDHDAAGRAARKAAQLNGTDCVRFPIWSWHREATDLRLQPEARRFELSTDGRAAKQRALSQFRSQLAERPGSAIVPAHVLEYFSRPYEIFLL